MIKSSSLLLVAHVAASETTTPLTNALNAQIKEGTNGVYSGGKGVLVRTPDMFTENSQLTVVPATFWTNDLKPPSTLYPNGNPWCPHGASDGYESLSWSQCDYQDGPWEMATVAAVVGETGMKAIWKDNTGKSVYDDMQNSDWGWGVFYATDANAADKRCFYESSSNGWNCPGGWVDMNGNFQSNPSMQGAGYNTMGNPDAGMGGGGAGCHFDTNSHKIDQVDATDNQNRNLVKDYNCQCNYDFNQNWNEWVDDWIYNNKQKPGFEWRKWLGGGGKAPTWAVDTTMCWVNNPRDMIMLQNAVWNRRQDWNNDMAPLPEGSHIRYWGWNEVPVTKSVIDNPQNWDAVMMKLPAGVQKVSDLTWAAQTQLEKDIDSFVQKNFLVPGKSNIKSKPGSAVVMVREVSKGPDDYDREFYCEDWKSANQKYHIQSLADCFIDSATSVVV